MAIVYRQNQEGILSVEQMDGNFSYIDGQLVDLNSTTLMLEEATSFLQQETMDLQDSVAGITASIIEVIEPRLAPLTYIGLASQVDTDVPTFIELQNTIGTITWEYSATGSYIGTVGTTFSYIFVPNNDAIFATPLGVSSSVFLYIYQITKLSESTLSLVTVPFEGPGAGAYDNILQNTPIEIKFYK